MTPTDRRPDRRSATDWYLDHQGRRPRGRKLPLLLVSSVALAVVAGGFYAGGGLLGYDPTTSSRDAVSHLLNDIPDLPPLPPDEAPPEPDPEVAPDPDTQVDLDPDEFLERYRRLIGEQPNLVEGRDYSFIRKVDGVPVRWSCSRPIPVVLAGDVPPGTEASFDVVVRALAAASDLPLQAERDADGRPPTSGEIVVYYASEGVAPGTFSAEGTVAGRAGPRYWLTGPAAGFVGSGEVVVRDDIPALEPTTEPGRHVLAHEIMHAIGIAHSEEEMPEVMAPKVNDMWPTIGQGDQLALRVVGCGA